jgi:hypothetical protein
MNGDEPLSAPAEPRTTRARARRASRRAADCVLLDGDRIARRGSDAQRWPRIVGRGSRAYSYESRPIRRSFRWRRRLPGEDRPCRSSSGRKPPARRVGARRARTRRRRPCTARRPSDRAPRACTQAAEANRKQRQSPWAPRRRTAAPDRRRSRAPAKPMTARQRCTGPGFRSTGHAWLFPPGCIHFVCRRDPDPLVEMELQQRC